MEVNTCYSVIFKLSTFSPFLNQIEKSDFSRFEHCATLEKESFSVFPNHRCINIIIKLLRELENRFKDNRSNEKDSNLFKNPFNIDAENIESPLRF